MILPPYIQFKDDNGSYLLCTHSPFLIGKIWKFKDNQADKFTDWCNNTHSPFSKIDGYRIAISFSGTLLKTGYDVKPDAILQDMARYYHDNVIAHKQGYFKLFKQ
jgi:hypothetical protein